ncbi:MAG: hypothetical protein MJK18_08915, partial [Bdellovibrionales bacterium]|nr:hypothetical protein [Bdellovibrionales bacterium]
MKILGISALSHDASLTLIEEGEILMASHSERYSRVKNDAYLNDSIVDEMRSFGEPDQIVWYEKPWKKKSRQLYAGQWSEALSFKHLPKKYLKNWDLHKTPLTYQDHHESHAAGGFYTSPFDEATVVVIDAIGEWDTVSLWQASADEGLKCLKRIQYPYSLGLLYSAFTQRCGLKPNEEEYILMGMAAYGKPIYRNQIKSDFFDSKRPFQVKESFHRGIGDYLPDADLMDLAASIQQLTEETILDFMKMAQKLYPSNNLIYSGGVALNCLANNKLYDLFPKIWIMPNPGDAGSSLGAAAAYYKKPLHWKTPYLGTLIPGDYPVKELLKELLSGNIVGVANGRAEFGPRALGNSSLFADPSAANGKEKVNEIKKRQ